MQKFGILTTRLNYEPSYTIRKPVYLHMRIHVTDADFRLCIQSAPELLSLIYIPCFNNKLLIVPRLYFCCVSLLPVFDANFFDISTYVCTAYVATFWERAAHSVDRLFFLYYVYMSF